MAHHLIRIRDPGEVLTRRAGLLTLPTSRRTTLRTRRRRRFRQPFRRRRHRRVTRVLTQPHLEIRDPSLELTVALLQSVEAGAQIDVLANEILVRGRGRGCTINGRNVSRNSQRYARRSPRWWTAPLQHLNSYTGASPPPRTLPLQHRRRPASHRPHRLVGDILVEHRSTLLNTLTLSVRRRCRGEPTDSDVIDTRPALPPFVGNAPHILIGDGPSARRPRKTYPAATRSIPSHQRVNPTSTRRNTPSRGGTPSRRT